MKKDYHSVREPGDVLKLDTTNVEGENGCKVIVVLQNRESFLTCVRVNGIESRQFVAYDKVKIGDR